MKKLFTLMMIVSLSIMASCSFFEEKVIPVAKEKASEAVSKAIVREGQCSNPAVVKAATDKLFKVESDESALVSTIADAQVEVAKVQSLTGTSSVIAQSLCKSAVAVALSPLIKRGVPSEWGCSLENVSSKLEAIALGACDKI